MRSVLITQRANKNKYNCDIDVLEHCYVSYLEKYNVRLIAIPNSTSCLEEYFDIGLQIHGIVLSGGNDVSPELYCGDKKKSSGISNGRDNCEKRILNTAIEKKIPVFGICRGLQFINVYFGGKISQDIRSHNISQHSVVVQERDISKNLNSKEVVVNSFHNQGVFPEDLSPELRVFAIDKTSGVIEGLYHPQRPIAAVQWHPEREKKVKKIDRLLTKSFLKNELFWGK